MNAAGAVPEFRVAAGSRSNGLFAGRGKKSVNARQALARKPYNQEFAYDYHTDRIAPG
jgi:hypothetical protein